MVHNLIFNKVNNKNFQLFILIIYSDKFSINILGMTKF